MAWHGYNTSLTELTRKIATPGVAAGLSYNVFEQSLNDWPTPADYYYGIQEGRCAELGGGGGKRGCEYEGCVHKCAMLCMQC